MELLTLPYALFVAATALVFHALPGRFRPAFLLAVSVLLYGYYSPVSAAILVVSAMIVFGAARALDSLKESTGSRQLVFGGAVAILLGHLLLIKSLPLLHARGRALGTGSILIALGVSYYTFKLLGYLIDVYWQKYPASHDFIGFLAYATFFPQLAAGPIQRADDFKFPENGPEIAELMTQGLKRIFWGMVKKIVLADQLASVIAHIDGGQPQLSNALWIAACLYAIELYFDFAALTDIAVGTAAVLGFKSPENFDYPFFAPSMSQFWRRWHMTLTFWLTDYVFTPLRMSTRNIGNWGLALSLMVTMALIGLWHGINIGCLIFGLANGAYLIVDSLTSSWRRKYYRRHPGADRITNLIGPVFVFCMIAFSLVFFRAATMANVTYQMRHLWDGLGAPIASIKELSQGYTRRLFAFIGLATASGLGIELWGYLQQKGERASLAIPKFPIFPVPLRWLVYYAGIAIAETLHQQNIHFIYVQF